MKHLLAPLALLFLLMGCSPQGRHPYGERLLKVEKLLAASPDSVVFILDRDTTLRLHGQADSMLFNLLYAESYLLRPMSFSSDTALNCAIDYFRRTKDKPRLVRTYLARATNRYRNGAYQDAMADALRARQLAGKGNDSLRYRAFSILGSINNTTGCYHQAIDCFRKALQLLKSRHPDADELVMTYNELAVAYDHCGLRDSFMRCMKAIRPLLMDVSQETGIHIQTTLGDYYMRAGVSDTAEIYLRGVYYNALDHRAPYLLGNLYASQGRTEEARKCWTDAASASTDAVAIAAIDSLLAPRNAATVPDSEFDALLLRLQNRYFHYLPTPGDAPEIAGIQADFDHHLQQTKAYRRIIWLLATVIGLLLGLMAFYVYHRRRVQFFKSRLKSVNNRYLADLEAYHKARSDVEQLRQKIAAYQDDQPHPGELNMTELMLTAEPVWHLHRVAARGQQAQQADWAELAALLQQHDSGFGAALDAHTELNHTERGACLLIRLRFIPSEIAALLGLSPQQVTNLRVRLLQKMFNRKGGARDFDVAIRDL